MKLQLKPAISLILATAVAFFFTSCDTLGIVKADTTGITETVETAASDVTTTSTTAAETAPTTATAVTTAAPYTFPPVDETKTNIEAKGYSDFISQVQASLKYYSGSVLISYSGQIIYADGFQYADKTKKIKNSMNTTFEIGSVNKQFTAAAILQLRDKNLLSVYDTLDKYFPDYKYGKDITIKNLLQMRSGIADHLDDPDDFFSDRSVVADMQNKLLNGGTFDNDFVEKYLNDSKLLFEPNSEYSYSSTNYYLLSKIIEKVSGMSYEQYIQKNIFKPLGMTNSVCGLSQAKGNGGEEKYPSYPVNVILGAGCISTNVIDFYKWDEALYHGQVVASDTFSEMTSFVDGYGYGLAQAGSYVGHTGSTLSFTTEAYKDPLKDLTILLFSNETEMGDGSSIGACLNRIIKLCSVDPRFI